MQAWGLLAPAVMVLSAASQQNGNPAEELKKLRGTWVATALQADGTEVPADKVKAAGISITFEDDRYTYQAAGAGKTEKGRVRINAGKEPHTMDIIAAEGPDKGKPQLAIYKLEGDRLTVCYARIGKDRPADFTAKAGSGKQLAVFTRAKRK